MFGLYRPCIRFLHCRFGAFGVRGDVYFVLTVSMVSFLDLKVFMDLLFWFEGLWIWAFSSQVCVERAFGFMAGMP